MVDKLIARDILLVAINSVSLGELRMILGIFVLLAFDAFENGYTPEN